MTTIPGWRRVAWSTGAVAVLAVAFTVATSMGPNLVLLVGLVALVAATWWLLTTVGRAAEPFEPWDVVARPAPGGTGIEGVALWSRYRVPSGPRDLQGAERLYATLVAIIDDRLATRHGIDRERDPDAARAVLGDELARFAADPDAAHSLIGLPAVARLVDRIEQI